MPHQLMATKIRADNVITGLRLATTLVDELHDALGTSALQAISQTTVSLATAMQNTKKNKFECIRLLEDTHRVLCAIIDLHLKSDMPGTLPPPILDHIGAFTQTIHKIHTYLEAQYDGNRIWNFFRNNELKTSLKDCQAGLKHAMEVFQAESGGNVLLDVGAMRRTADIMHIELLEMISSLSDDTNSDKASSIHPALSGSQMSSTSFCMLPPRPKIFHGRESELDSIVELLSQDSARIAILGAGGMGKTSLARAALHHTETVAKYGHRIFVSCGSARTGMEIAMLIGDHISIVPGKDLTPEIIQYFWAQSRCLLILDNLETPWEPLESRKGVEDLLSLLTDIPHLALIITMRGSERPAKVRWTKPFLLPLQPLSDDAARQVFVDIADNYHDQEDLNQVLKLTQNMPLALDLIAHLVDHEGCSSVLARWQQERTSLLSVGYDRRSNLDASIQMSLSSPKLTSSPGAMDLLRLLSILPDGLSDIELVQSSLPVQDVLTCKAVLLGTCLAYDDNRRLKSLVPIREHMQHFHPPSASLIQPLQNYFHALLDLYKKYQGSQHVATIVNQINSNFGNLNQILLQGLHANSPDVAATIICTLSLSSLSRLTGRGWLSLMDSIPAAFPRPCDPRLKVQFITEVLDSSHAKLIEDSDVLISQAKSHFSDFNDPVLESKFYRALATLHEVKNNYPEAIRFLDKAFVLVQPAGDTTEQTGIACKLANIKMWLGDYIAGQSLAIEAQRLAQLSGNLFKEASALWTQAYCCQARGDLKNSVLLLERAKTLVQLCGMSGGELENRIMCFQAEAHYLKSEYVEARQIQTQIADTTSPQHNAISHAYALLGLADIDIIIAGGAEDVRHKLHNATVLFQNNFNYGEGIILCEIAMAKLQLQEGDLLKARTIFLRYLQWPWMGDDDIWPLCLQSIANMDYWEGSYFHESFWWSVIYLALAKKFQARLELHKALKLLAQVFLVNGDEVTAESLFAVALNGFTYMDVHQSRADCMLHLGDIARKQGHLAKALSLWENAKILFERSLQAKDVDKIDGRLAKLEQHHQENLAHLVGLNVPMVPLQPQPILRPTVHEGDEVKGVADKPNVQAVLL